MAGKCKTCSHPDRELIDAAILGKASYRTIADRFGISETALKRHAENHIPVFLAEASKAEEVLQADRLLAEEVEDRALVRGKFKQLSSPQLKGTDKAFWLQCRREVSRSTELLLRASGEWREKQAVELSGKVTTEAEQIDTAVLAFVEQKHPELKPELLHWLKDWRERELSGDQDS
jgi:hypothetical protein